MKLKELLMESENVENIAFAISCLDNGLNESELLVEFSLSGLKSKLKNLILKKLDASPNKKEDAAGKLTKAISSGDLDRDDIEKLLKKSEDGTVSLAEIEKLAAESKNSIRKGVDASRRQEKEQMKMLKEFESLSKTTLAGLTTYAKKELGNGVVTDIKTDYKVDGSFLSAGSQVFMMKFYIRSYDIKVEASVKIKNEKLTMKYIHKFIATFKAKVEATIDAVAEEQ